MVSVHCSFKLHNWEHALCHVPTMGLFFYSFFLLRTEKKEGRNVYSYYNESHKKNWLVWFCRQFCCTQYIYIYIFLLWAGSKYMPFYSHEFVYEHFSELSVTSRPQFNPWILRIVSHWLDPLPPPLLICSKSVSRVYTASLLLSGLSLEPFAINWASVVLAVPHGFRTALQLRA